jgi:hypothetical protein
MTKPDASTSISLLTALSEYQDFHSAIFFTYCADLAFFEVAVSYQLWSNGCRNNLLFMDAQRYADTLGDMRSSVTWVGRRYIVCPVQLESRQAFHPKMILLVGQERGRLLIGSGNLNFTGLGHNYEVYSCLDWTPDEPRMQYLFVQAWRLVKQVNDQWGYSVQANNMLHKAEYIAPWLETDAYPPDDIHLLHTLDGALIRQLGQQLAGQAIRKLTVVTPFLDGGAAALEALYRQFTPQEFHLVLQPGRAVGDVEKLTKLRAKTPLQVYRFNAQDRYLHAKVVVFEADEASYVLTGSPNCTRSAMLLPPADSNVEVALLRRGEKRRQFAYVLKSKVSSRPLRDLTKLDLRADWSLTGEGDPAPVQLMDASITGGVLVVHYRVVHVPKDVMCLQLRLSTVSPAFLPLEICTSGEHTVQLPLSKEQLVSLNRPCTVAIQGQDAHHNPVDLRCNELWITNADVLRAQIMRIGIAGTRSGGYLAEGMPASDEEWSELYQTLAELIVLDVTRLKRKGGTYTASPKEKPLPSTSEPEKEIEIRIVDEDELAAEQERAAEEDVATLLFQESQFYAWLEHVRGRLPGAASELTETGDEIGKDDPDGDPGPGGKPGLRQPRRKWTPKEHIGRRFTHLVHKYINSLHNVEYMQSISILHALTYFVVFQRIVWLLFEHGVIDQDGFIRFVLDMNAGFFGASEEPAPLLVPRLRRHIQRTWEGEWQEYEVGLWALVSMDIATQRIGENNQVLNPVKSYRLHFNKSLEKSYHPR